MAAPGKPANLASHRQWKLTEGLVAALGFGHCADLAGKQIIIRRVPHFNCKPTSMTHLPKLAWALWLAWLLPSWRRARRVQLTKGPLASAKEGAQG